MLSAARFCVAQTTSPYEPLLKSLSWRNIGPAIMGGRIDDFAVVENNPSIVYVGTAAGGVFKSVNRGTTWESVFDNQTVSSIGDVTVAPSDPNVVWVGTGEANNRQSSSWGDGVYKSTDAGKTWTHMGLENTHHIGRIVIDPRDPNVVCVAAGGDLWGPSKDRGLYRTTDGGKTWTKTLFINEDTGCSDLVTDLTNPDIIYTSAYQRRRSAFGFNGGGPGSGIYKSTDGGATWKKCTNGLPTGDTGRIGLDIYRKDSNIVYACVENANGGVFRSEDKGETWKKMGTVSMSINAYRPCYFSQIRVDPKDDQHIWMAAVNMGVSTDGGKTFRPVGPAIHADVHAIWIDPNNPSQALVGCDGGIQWTYDSGRTWDYMNVLALAQFYEVHYDMRKPYWVYGGLQDNGSWACPSSTLTFRGPTNDEWINVGGGDGFYVQADPVDDKTIYSESQQGAVARLNVTTGERKSIRPRPEPGEQPYRFDWNTPILISMHDHNKIFVAGNRLFISTDRGDSWRRTDDLTTNIDRTKLPIMG
ncbi:MAG: glycosyl hydrolase, repeat, partial [Chthonomonadaceae bacterium]|nr:glycosyl hydrolase, repeat [Chthonomonadaceae bacterium]